MNPPLPLRELARSPDYAASIAAAVAEVAVCSDEAAAVSVLYRATLAMGVDAAAFVSFVKDDDAHDAFRFLLACDPVWCAQYEQRAWYAVDPWLHYAREHTEPARGVDVPLESSLQREIVSLAQDHGFRDALIVPAPSSGQVSRLGVLCLGSTREGFFADDGYLVLKMLARSLAMELHAWWIGRIKAELRDWARLTDEDLALLKRERQGHSTKAIAAALDSTDSAVNSRFQRMNARLGVPNRKVAAQLAAEYGLI